MPDPGLEPARVARIAAALAVGERDPTYSLCVASAVAIGVAGAGVILMSGGKALGSVCASGPMTEAVEEVQFTLGEGPCVDAFRTKEPVLAPDLADPRFTRWPGFGEGARTAGVRAAFGFPLLIQSVCFGALNLYHDVPGALTDEQYADAIAVAHVASRQVLGWQSVAGPGSLAWQLEHVPMHRAVVHQAGGMVSVQADISVADAVVMLRAYSFAEDRPIGDVATDIVSGVLRLDGERMRPDEPR
jgi:GAF domain-containing protein